MKLLASILPLLGILSLLAAGFLATRRYLPATPSFNVSTPRNQPSDSTSTFLPVRFEIPDLAINLPVVPATITNGKWETTKNGVSFLTNSSVPGTRGNSVIYGHNTPNLLGSLSRIKPGQKLIVERQDGSRLTYAVENTAVVTPDQTHILDQTEDERLTIFTCVGLFDQKRFVAVATLDRER